MKKLILVTFFLFSLILSSVVMADPVIIRHWYDVPQSQEEEYKAMIDRFNETHTDVQVNWENVPSRKLEQKVLIGSQAGDLPDTFVVSSNDLAQFTAMEILAPLNDYVGNWKAIDDVMDSLWQHSKVANNIYGIPWKMQIMYLYYRADWFKEKGIEPPATIAELTDAAIKLTEDTDGDGRVDRYGIGLRGGAGAASHYNSYLWTFGAKYLDQQGNVVFDSKEAVEGTQWLIDLFSKYKVTPRTAPADSFQQIIGSFKSGKTAMQLHHIGTYAEMVEVLGDKVSAIPMPKGPNGDQGTLGTVHMHVISKTSDKKEAAFKFISWMSEKWAHEYQAKNIGSVPILKSVSEEPFFQNNRFYRASIESIPFVKTPPKKHEYNVVKNEVIGSAFQQGLMGEKSSEEVVKEIADALKKELNK